MTLRSVLIALLYAFFTLLVAFAVVMGGYLLAVGVQDSPLASVLRIMGMVCLVLLAVDALLLVLALTVRAIDQDDRRAAVRTPVAGADEPPRGDDEPRAGE